MSLAKLHITEKSRKIWRCRKCGVEIPKGSRVIRFTVGFRGRPQERCSKPECYPLPSERESSLVADVYAAQESVDFSTAQSKEDIDNMIQDVISACEEVVGQYEENPMYDNNYDMQERADQIRSAGEELENWSDSLDDEPEQGEYERDEDFEIRLEEWMVEARDAAESAVNDMELP